VSGKRIGLLGMGNIGQAIARRARGFDMQVLYHDRKPVRGWIISGAPTCIPWRMRAIFW
jgi:lactate dehydrogenase-like 2-hydroxyacid dehydrogenase